MYMAIVGWLYVCIRGDWCMASRRFESGNPPRMSKAQVRQQLRILTDEKIEAQEQLVKNDSKATQRAIWNDSLEEASERKALKNKAAAITQEVELANKSLTKVRRAQLGQLLEEEQIGYETELHAMGLTFPKDRL